MTTAESTPELLAQWDRQYIWKPFTQMKEYAAGRQIIIDRGDGIYLYDIAGNRYIDGISSWWVNLHGHRHPVLGAALREQLDKVAHCALASLTHEPAIGLARELAAVLPPGLTRIFYSDNGSTAVEVALKMSFQYWRNLGRTDKRTFVSLANAYHGDTLGAVSVGGIEQYHALFKPLLFDTFRVPAPYCYRCPAGKRPETCRLECQQPLTDLLMEHADEICGIIVEPLVMAVAGMLVYPPAYLRRLRELADRYDVHLIADEVAVAFGRTGRMFACEHAGITPDLMCMAKGLTGGYLPLAVTAATDRIYEAFWGDYADGRTFFHGHSYTGNPLAAAIGRRNLEYFREAGIIAGLQPKVEYFQQQLQRFRELEHAGDVRGMGMIGAVEMVADRRCGEPYPADRRIGKLVADRCLETGAYLRPLGDVLYFIPPLCIENDQLDELFAIAFDAVRGVTEGREA
ncbi:MAG: adenosylmethionine--8-amino-7-oxononanoate transaminase [Deltaproteobacteria bacterium]|nr:adenosylmethionine--8-amino-7-oxononanoate transaminase [Candidatus Anaeroferrophillacea bacterium]